MKKQLIMADSIDELVCQKAPKIFADPASYILSPGAIDALRKRNVEIIYEPCPYTSSCDHTAGAPVAHPQVDDFLISVAAVLKNEYGITQPEELKKMTLQIVKTIKDNI